MIKGRRGGDVHSHEPARLPKVGEGEGYLFTSVLDSSELGSCVCPMNSYRIRTEYYEAS